MCDNLLVLSGHSWGQHPSSIICEDSEFWQVQGKSEESEQDKSEKVNKTRGKARVQVKDKRSGLSKNSPSAPQFLKQGESVCNKKF